METKVLHHTDAPLSPRFEPDYLKVTDEIRQYVPENVTRVFVMNSKRTADGGKLYTLDYNLFFKTESGKEGGTWLHKNK